MVNSIPLSEDNILILIGGFESFQDQVYRSLCSAIQEFSGNLRNVTKINHLRKSEKRLRRQERLVDGLEQGLVLSFKDVRGDEQYLTGDNIDAVERSVSAPAYASEIITRSLKIPAGTTDYWRRRVEAIGNSYLGVCKQEAIFRTMCNESDAIIRILQAKQVQQADGAQQPV